MGAAAAGAAAAVMRRAIWRRRRRRSASRARSPPALLPRPAPQHGLLWFALLAVVLHLVHLLFLKTLTLWGLLIGAPARLPACCVRGREAGVLPAGGGGGSYAGEGTGLRAGLQLRQQLEPPIGCLHAGALAMGPTLVLPSVHLGLSGGFIFSGEVGLRWLSCLLPIPGALLMLLLLPPPQCVLSRPAPPLSCAAPQHLLAQHLCAAPRHP